VAGITRTGKLVRLHRRETRRILSPAKRRHRAPPLIIARVYRPVFHGLIKTNYAALRRSRTLRLRPVKYNLPQSARYRAQAL